MWTAITHSEQLPPLQTSEQTWLDFKAQPTASQYEMAKDVAAIANATGGTLIVGAAENGSRLSAFVPLSVREATQVARSYQEAVRDRVRPLPIVDAHPLSKNAGYVVVVNVQPFLGQAVGVHVKPPETDLHNLFHYPLRVSTQTVFLTPEQLPMFTDARIRRIAILLEQARGSRVEIQLPPSADGRLHPAAGTIYAVNIATNTLEIGWLNEGPNVRIPLDLIAGVCEGFNAPWQLFLRGRFVGSGQALRFIPD